MMEPLSSTTERIVLGNAQLESSQGTGEKKNESLCSYFLHNMQEGKF